MPSMHELEIAIKLIGKRVGLDEIPPSMAQILPLSMKDIILALLQRVFANEYPEEWSKQILHSITKDGHTPMNPKLCAISIPPLLCRLYDIIIDIQFCSWYNPNLKQAGFRAKQGCLLQLFMLLLLIQFPDEKDKELYTGFLDYEKAFDFATELTY